MFTNNLRTKILHAWKAYLSLM